MASDDTHRLRLYPYSGGFNDLIEGDHKKVRREAARALRRHRKELGYLATIIIRGKHWELQTAEDAVAISDFEGQLCIEKIKQETYCCFECGDDLPVGMECDCRDNHDSLTTSYCTVCGHECEDDEDTICDGCAVVANT